ncbi:MAG: hypothetical protein ACLTDM_19555 [Clostridium butyricum]
MINNEQNTTPRPPFVNTSSWMFPLTFLGATYLFIAWFNSVETIFEKMLIGMCAVCFLCPMIPKFFLFIFSIGIKKQKTDYVAKQSNVEYKKTSVGYTGKKAKGKTKENTYEVKAPSYLPCKAMISQLCQEKKLKRKDMLNLISELEKRLGKENLEYYKNYKWQNDMKHIYVLLKNFNLKEEDYVYLIDWLRCIK